MNIQKEINKILIGYKIKYPNENIEEILSKHIIDNDIYEYFTSKKNYFAINKDLKKMDTKKEIIRIMYETWCTFLDNYDYFSFSKNYIIFIKDKKINIVGHIEIEDLDKIKSTMIDKIKNKSEMHAIFYPVYSPGKYIVEDTEIEVNEIGEIKCSYNGAEYGSVNETSYKKAKNKIFFLTQKYINGDNIKKEDLEEIIQVLTKKYIKMVDINEVLEENGFTIFKPLKKVTNAKSVKLQNKISGKLIEGQIDLSVDRGYKTHPERPQQDAALSIIKNENIFLNVIADGAGGSEKGEKASNKTVTELKKWFELLPDELFEDINIIIELLKQKINEIDTQITQKYEKSYTTVVLALTINDKTIIANIGDSTAYTYDSDKDELILLSKLDSDSDGMSYEDARYNPWNNSITAAIGDGYNKKLHINIIDNQGQTIILSSDGITDLISEERFKSYFIDDTDTSQMIKDALSKEDTEWLNKTEDNISVIKIKLKNMSKTKNR